MLINKSDEVGKKIIKDVEYDSSNNGILYKEIELAKREWEFALKRFNDVTDPEVIDYIVFYIIAAERRYMYLLNKYRDIHNLTNKTNVKKMN